MDIMVRSLAESKQEMENKLATETKSRGHLADRVSWLEFERDALAERVKELKQRLPKAVGDVNTCIPALQEFSRKDLQVATHDFDVKWNNCGHGDEHEHLYFGKLWDNSLVMVKKMRDVNTQAIHRDKLKSEVVDKLILLRHPQMLIPLGVCYEDGCLVYEHMAHGTVKDWIACTRQSTWYTRFRLMAEVARGLCFLHSDPLGSGGPIIHSAIRPTNIFLDDKFVAKIGDVDLALLDSEPAQVVETTLKEKKTSRVVANHNSHYVAPEYWESQVFSEETDIFAFGITLLEMLTGNFTNAFEVVEDAIEDDNAFENALDPNAGCWDIDLARRVASLGLRCASYNRRKRPDMAAPNTGILAILEEVAGNVELAASREDE
ncbi:hypothetical protein CBR_g50905 [Chara braunii]|uniref:Protein kinase domain-containing protein n=1 Tax=Chara braunii TaxID=69332 RepID=A0A388M7X2_CHABU|nr:hypothetical protein CBR_g50905 [Chara braunii]|eukprot:GBG90562.1 hypothetical protein CBR_g50905 [Chara braunii]